MRRSTPSWPRRELLSPRPRGPGRRSASLDRAVGAGHAGRRGPRGAVLPGLPALCAVARTELLAGGGPPVALLRRPALLPQAQRDTARPRQRRPDRPLPAASRCGAPATSGSRPAGTSPSTTGRWACSGRPTRGNAGGRPLAGRLLDGAFTGPDWLTGGLTGAQASVFTMAVVAALFAVFHWRHRQQRYPDVGPSDP